MFSPNTGGPFEAAHVASRLNVVALAILAALLALGAGGMIATGTPIPLVAGALAGAVLMQAPRVAGNGSGRWCCGSADSSGCAAPASSGSCRSSTRSRESSTSA